MFINPLKVKNIRNKGRPDHNATKVKGNLFSIESVLENNLKLSITK